ncbi:MAG: ATP-binding protein [Gammaproteobacteria bacterium]|nr:ATP-binding protein [Gammaproteobacteria bacterium]MCW8987029.1 ATP-binding protein [Gammaproteobacteria bacterium]
MNFNGTCISSTTDEHGPIYVYQTRSCRILSFDGKIQQSRMKLNDINGLAHGYTQAMMSGLFFIPAVKTATIMGLGAGSMAKNLLSSFSKLNVHAIEYREAVAKTAKKYFHLPESDRLTIHIDDAMSYMKHSSIKSDIIFSDLYNTDGMEPKQVQSSYLRDCKNALNQQGILVLNIWHTALNSREELDELLALEFEDRLLSFEVESGNTIVLAFKNNIPSIRRKELLARGKWLQQKMNIPAERYAKLLWSTQQYKF